MPQLVLFNKPFNVLSQFTDKSGNRQTLSDYLSAPNLQRHYPAGRLDFDSEGLLLLTDNGALQDRICNPRNKMPKTYTVQVEGVLSEDALARLRAGVELNDGMTAPAIAHAIPEPIFWPRNPPVRYRESIPTSWLELTITEGRNRQVRRMTAAVGFPTLRLIRTQIGPWKLGALQPGEFRIESVHLPQNLKIQNLNKNRNDKNRRVDR